MKKFFFMAAAMFAAVSMNAQYFHVNMTGLSADAAAVPTQAFASDANVGTLSAGDAAETFKIVNVKTDSYAFFFAGETALNTDTMGVQGQNNGKDADGGNPANTLLPFASGAALKFVAAENGYLTVFHKASSNKQYVVFDEGQAISYEFAQLAKTDEGMEVVSYTLPADAEGYFTGEKIDFVEVIAGKSTDNSWKKNGESAIRFPVYAGDVYLFGATGSKMSILGVYFSTAKEEISVAKADGADKLVLLPAGEPKPEAIENNAEAVKATKVVENGQLVIIKNGVRYNAVGAQL